MPYMMRRDHVSKPYRLAPHLRLKSFQRLVRLKWSIQRRKFLAWLLLRVLQARQWIMTKSAFVGNDIGAFSATLIGLTAGAALFFWAPDDVFSDSATKYEVHLAVAGIAGTALALMFSLAIIPAQRAVDAFSTAILRLYARDKTILLVFLLISLIGIVSVLMGTGWAFSISTRYTLAIQILFLGITLDAIRQFYLRALQLLNPVVALSLVQQECAHHIDRIGSDVERSVRLHKFIQGKDTNERSLRFFYHSQSNLQNWLQQWTGQLNEFAAKSLLRRDTLAAKFVVETIAVIGARYVEMRRSSVVVLPDRTEPLLGSSDISSVLSDVCENITQICKDAAIQRNEAVVQKCCSSLAELTAHTITITNAAPVTRAPLAFSPMHYLDVCAKIAVDAKMEDGVLAAIRGCRLIIGRISKEVDTNEVDSKMIEMLNHIAVESYNNNSTVNCFAAADMMLMASFCEIRTRGFHGRRSITKDVLGKISDLVGFEFIMEAAGKRRFQTFPAYNITNEFKISRIFDEIAKKIEPPPEGRPYSNPFYELEDAARDFVQHYRSIADKVRFTGILLEKWIIESVLECIDVCLRILETPPKNTDRHLDVIENELRWFIGVPTFFFRKGENFAFHHAEETCSRLAAVGVTLIELRRPDAALACGNAIRSIATSAIFSKSTDFQNNIRSYVKCVRNLEVLARTAEVFDLTEEGSTLRSYITHPEGVIQEAGTSLSEQLASVPSYIDKQLESEDWGLQLEPDPISLLRKLLRDKKRAVDGNLPP
jgi:hypothetical protein